MTEDERGAASTPPRSECCIAAPSVIDSQPDGNVGQAWGGLEQHPAWPQNEHGVFADAADNIWIAGNGAFVREVFVATRTRGGGPV
jgi:hypothetical protein